MSPTTPHKSRLPSPSPSPETRVNQDDTTLRLSEDPEHQVNNALENTATMLPRTDTHLPDRAAEPDADDAEILAHISAALHSSSNSTRDSTPSSTSSSDSLTMAPDPLNPLSRSPSPSHSNSPSDSDAELAASWTALDRARLDCASGDDDGAMEMEVDTETATTMPNPSSSVLASAPLPASDLETGSIAIGDEDEEAGGGLGRSLYSGLSSGYERKSKGVQRQTRILSLTPPASPSQASLHRGSIVSVSSAAGEGFVDPAAGRSPAGGAMPGYGGEPGKSMVYRCGSRTFVQGTALMCDAEVTVRVAGDGARDRLRCRSCGGYLLYKVRTKRMVQFEAR